MSNNVDPDETAHMSRYEPSHLDLLCLHMYLFWSAGLNYLKNKQKKKNKTEKKKTNKQDWWEKKRENFIKIKLKTWED